MQDLERDVIHIVLFHNEMIDLSTIFQVWQQFLPWLSKTFDETLSAKSFPSCIRLSSADSLSDIVTGVELFEYIHRYLSERLYATRLTTVWFSRYKG